MQQIITKALPYHLAKAAVGGPSFTDDNLYLALIKDTCASFGKLDTNARLAIEAAYVFSRKAPLEERQDLFQEFVIAVLDSGTEKAEFAYALVRRDWQNWYASYKLRSHYHGGYLSETIMNPEGDDTELAELLVGETEFEAKQIDRLDAERLWDQLPEDIQHLVRKRLMGRPLGVNRKRKAGQPKSSGTLGDTERKRLNRWVKTEGYKLLIN